MNNTNQNTNNVEKQNGAKLQQGQHDKTNQQSNPNIGSGKESQQGQYQTGLAKNPNGQNQQQGSVNSNIGSGRSQDDSERKALNKNLDLEKERFQKSEKDY